jgi:type 1 glutamine amidotransferase
MNTFVVRNTKQIADLSKRCTATAITSVDQYRIGDVWYSAKGIAHGTHADEVRQANRYTFVKNDVIRINPLFEGVPINVQIVSIRAVEVAKLTDSDFAQLGYINVDDYTSDGGDIYGPRVWLMAIKPVVPGTDND